MPEPLPNPNVDLNNARNLPKVIEARPEDRALRAALKKLPRPAFEEALRQTHNAKREGPPEALVGSVQLFDAPRDMILPDASGVAVIVCKNDVKTLKRILWCWKTLSEGGSLRPETRCEFMTDANREVYEAGLKLLERMKE